MRKMRLVFEKTGSARYISHLDLMNVFRRSFLRADIPIHYTGGFNPHPYLSVALPLPTAFDGKAELLDFDLDCDDLPIAFAARLNNALPVGIRVKEVYDRVTQPKTVTWASYTVQLHGEGLDCGAVTALFDREMISITKKSKSGETEVNLKDFINTLTAAPADDGIVIETILAAGTTKTINPSYLVKAMEQYIPDMTVEYATYCRNEIFTEDMNVFR